MQRFRFRQTPQGFLGGLVVKTLPADAGVARDAGLMAGLGRSPGGGNSNPIQYPCLENPMDRLSYFPFTFHFHALEKEMATHSSILAWRIPGMEEPGGLPSMGSHRVGHD